MYTMNDANVRMHICLLIICMICFFASLFSLRMFVRKLSSPVASICWALLISSAVTIIYLLMTGVSANGFLD